MSGKFPRIFKKFWIFLEISENFPEISVMTGNFNMVVLWENKILMYDLHKNNPMHTTMSNSPVEFLRKCNLTEFSRFFPPSFKYLCTQL